MQATFAYENFDIDSIRGYIYKRSRRRAGKLIELDLADGTSEADIEAMCRKLLANTVIENFRVERA